ncbi:hypothetical protein L6164_024743 [Bauhinia variegata]|uniref:Uncharacterized protein n=1 Tax=Bauhinia variegata TaxID=167791 RepID=A0ACB9LY73_BAUVA|nr:hypothetical protein L6164_024743 [Bauhinia variegata]
MNELENPSSVTVSTASGPEALLPLKKKRNLPGMPDPDAEVIALSPKTLLATNRFVCEICNKGFQRDQNLQLHRRGHNLPWKLRQRTTQEIRKRVYVCPEPSCVHHNPSRALGDLTGIKKHFCRKHGEKKWKCERCSKKYAVQSDWKAHMKTCGTKEYKCDCGTLFSRRDSFIMHRPFCEALAEESARTQTQTQTLAVSGGSDSIVGATSPLQPPLIPSISLVIQSSEIPENPEKLSPSTCLTNTVTSRTTSCSSSVFASSNAVATTQSSSFSNLRPSLARSDCPTTLSSISAVEPISLSLSTSLYLSTKDSSLFTDQQKQNPPQHSASPQPALSATALLQKAAQMGATASNASFLRDLGLATASSSGTAKHWNSHVKLDNSVLGLRLGSAGNASFSDMRFASQPMTRDLLGLSTGGSAGGATRGGLSALHTSFGGSFDVADTSEGEKS